MSRTKPNLNPRQHARVLARIAALYCDSRGKEHSTALRMARVALRLQYWLAGVSNGAEWNALFDTIEHNYSWGRITHEEAVWHLRNIGLAAVTGMWKFRDAIEKSHRLSQAWQRQKYSSFNPVRWELDFNKKHLDAAE